MTYEMSLLEHDEHKNHIPKNRKVIALRTEKDHLSDNLSDDDENLELLTIKFKKLIKQELKNKNKLEKKKRPKKKKTLKDESSDEIANCALTTFDNKVSNSP
ncbi:unnamed protein product, partial [Musa textilis]